jgi:hypothetical protein
MVQMVNLDARANRALFWGAAVATMSSLLAATSAADRAP